MSVCMSFNTQPRPKAAGPVALCPTQTQGVSTTAPAPPPLHRGNPGCGPCNKVSAHSRARRRLDTGNPCSVTFNKVSTHSPARRRLGMKKNPNPMTVKFQHTAPPEGGWAVWPCCLVFCSCFNTQPRPKAAGAQMAGQHGLVGRFNTQPRPKAAGTSELATALRVLVSTHSPARRRLEPVKDCKMSMTPVSTHSPARRRLAALRHTDDRIFRFQHTAPPEGGWGRQWPRK